MENRLLNRKIETNVTKHNYNNFKLPLTMDPLEYGVLILDKDMDESKRYVVKTDTQVFTIDVNKKATVNKVIIEGASDITWVDTKLDDNTFKRTIGKNVLYVRDGQVIVKEKELPAKAFTKNKADKNLAKTNLYLTMDIKTININNQRLPYLISAYNEKLISIHLLVILYLPLKLVICLLHLLINLSQLKVLNMFILIIYQVLMVSI